MAGNGKSLAHRESVRYAAMNRGRFDGGDARTQELGAERDADAHQQGRRPVSANTVGAGCAPHSGTVWRGQRSAALGFETGRAWREKWAPGEGDATPVGDDGWPSKQNGNEPPVSEVIRFGR